MTVKQLVNEQWISPVVLPNPNREIIGGYAGDLLSWVMGRAEAGNAWVTIMSNLNIVAVASLADVSCVILAEDVILDQECIQTAEEKGINILKTSLSTFECVSQLSKLI